MIPVNKDIIKALNPCEEGFQNYLKYYSEFNGSLKEFLDLEKIPYEDKIWLAIRLITKNQAVHWSILCAESVLSNFEKESPEDGRVRNCLEYLKTIEDFENLTEKQLEEIRKYKAATRAAERATWYVASSAARCATRCAASSAGSAESARYAASSAGYAVGSAGYAASSAAESSIEQEKKNLEFLKSVL